MRISDWSSDVCSSDLPAGVVVAGWGVVTGSGGGGGTTGPISLTRSCPAPGQVRNAPAGPCVPGRQPAPRHLRRLRTSDAGSAAAPGRSEEHTSELQSLMRISYAVFCLQKKTTTVL